MGEPDRETMKPRDENEATAIKEIEELGCGEILQGAHGLEAQVR
jgi:hypothetical protein